jgi:hypothetical protein
MHARDADKRYMGHKASQVSEKARVFRKFGFFPGMKCAVTHNLSKMETIQPTALSRCVHGCRPMQHVISNHVVGNKKTFDNKE